MRWGKDLAETEKVLIKEIAKVKTTKSIAEINRCVMTKIGESVRILGKSFKEETSV